MGRRTNREIRAAAFKEAAEPPTKKQKARRPIARAETVASEANARANKQDAWALKMQKPHGVSAYCAAVERLEEDGLSLLEAVRMMESQYA